MEIADFIASAVRAAGGRERLLAVRTYRAEIRRERAGGGSSTLVVWRAVGGCIRVEEVCGAERAVLVVDGDAGLRIDERGGVAVVRSAMPPEEIARMRRAARLAPRNLLAHAEEYDLRYLGRVETSRGPRLALEFPAESTIYFFDTASRLCLSTAERGGPEVLFSEYRAVDGIATPHLEREIAADGTEAEVRTYTSVAYNSAVPDGLFTIELR